MTVRGSFGRDAPGAILSQMDMPENIAGRLVTLGLFDAVACPRH
jgi:hypothetical protein